MGLVRLDVMAPAQIAATTAATAVPTRLLKFHAPEIVFGIDSMAEAAHAAVRLGGLRPMLVTDPGLIEAGWDSDVERRPHGQHTTVVVHFDLEKRAAALHLGLLLTDEERQLLLCDATCEVWLEKHGQPIGAGRSTRTISRRLRRALEHRDRCCRVPGCGATRGLHAHHIIHVRREARVFRSEVKDLRYRAVTAA